MSIRTYLSIILPLVSIGLCPQIALGSLAVKPAYLELQLDQGRPSDTIMVSNLSAEETRFRAHVTHFVYTESGGFEMVPPDEDSLVDWLKLNPREFSIEGQSSRMIRLAVVPPSGLEEGEYWGAIWFEPLSSRRSASTESGNQSMQLVIKSNILVPIVGTVGDVSHVVELSDLDSWRTEKGLVISARLANNGTGRVRLEGSYEVLDGEQTVVAEGLIGADTILPGGRRVFDRHVDGAFADGPFTVRVRYDSSKLEDVIAGQTTVRPGKQQTAPENSD